MKQNKKKKLTTMFVFRTIKWVVFLYKRNVISRVRTQPFDIRWEGGVQDDLFLDWLLIFVDWEDRLFIFCTVQSHDFAFSLLLKQETDLYFQSYIYNI